mgnify:CR=1 FL=1
MLSVIGGNNDRNFHKFIYLDIVKNCIAVVVLVVLTMGSSPFEFNGKTYVK